MAQQPQLVQVAAWKAALAPVVAVLGLVLPLTFLPRIGPYLHYLRPIELLPTYATAWLMLALLLVAPFLLAGIALWLLELFGLARLRRLGTWLLMLLAVSMAVAALLFDGLLWVETFSRRAAVPLDTGREVLLAGASGLISWWLLARARRGDARNMLGRAALLGTILGGVLAVTLPLFHWETDIPSGPGIAGGTEARQSTRPNILLVTIDALSAQHASLYGAARPTTPNLDAFGAGAVVFNHAYANGNFTTAGVSSILTGTRPWTHRALQIFSWPLERARRQSLPALLARSGYVTGYVATNSYAGASRLGMGAYFAFGRSDAVPLGLPCPDGVAAILPYECPAAQLPPLVAAQKLWNRLQEKSVFWTTNRHYDPERAVQPALAWLQTLDKRRPVFLWLHLFPPHAPYAAPSPWLGRFDASPLDRDPESTDPDDNYTFARLPPAQVRVLEARYDESVLYVDHYVGVYLARARQLLGDNTVIVVTADHGESFEHDYGGHGGPALYDSMIHIPLIIHYPYQAMGCRVDSAAEQVDIAPTLARLAGVAPPASWEGHALAAGCDAGSDDPAAAAPVFSMSFEESPARGALTNGSIAVIDGSWKLVHYMGVMHYPQMPALHDQLYDLHADPMETVNRIAGEPARARQLLEIAVAALVRHGGPVH